MVFDPALRQGMRRYLNALIDRPGAWLVHCVAGKDRTGLAVASLRLALGVPQDAVYADYLLTNEAPDNERRIAEGAQTIRQHLGEETSDAVIRILMSADADFLRCAFVEIEEQFGSVDIYLVEQLGITDSRRAALSERLVAADAV